jgi:hypothetical protein
MMATLTDSGLPPDARAAWTGIAPDTTNVTHYRAEITALYGSGSTTPLEIKTAAGSLEFPNVSIGDSILIPCHGTPSHAAIVIESQVAETHPMPACNHATSTSADPPNLDDPAGNHHRPDLSCQRINANANADTDRGAVLGIQICLNEADLP